MTVLIVQNDSNSDPGNIFGWLEDYGIDYVLARPHWEGDLSRIPINNFSGMIVTGGFQNAYLNQNGEFDSPWFGDLLDMINSVVNQDMPYLGICLGAQLLAWATGGKVAKASNGVEAGIKKVDLSLGLLSDSPFFRDLPAVVDVAMWHDSEVHELPVGAQLLASNGHSKVQAFSIANSLGTQFHWEYNYDMFVWRVNHYHKTIRELGSTPEQMLEGAEETFRSINMTGEIIFRNFSRLVHNYGKG